MRLQSIFLVLVFLFVSTTACNGGSSTTPIAPTYPLGKPTGVTAIPGSNSASVSWNPVPGAEGYFIYLSNDGVGFNRYSGDVVRGTAFTVFNLVNLQTYYFGVSAVGTGGWESSISYPGGAPTAFPVIPDDYGPVDPLDGIAPDPPRNLQGIAKDASAELTWDRPLAADFFFYRLWRTDPDGSTNLIKDNFFDTFYIDTDLENDLTYTYWLTSVDDEDPPLESDPSNVVNLTPLDLPPEMLKNVQIFVNPGRVILEWDVPSELDILAFIIERVQPDELFPDSQVVVRFELPVPTQPFSSPHLYAGGLLATWIDVDQQRIVLQDMAYLEIGKEYTYYLSAKDLAEHLGSVVEVKTPTPIY